MVQYRAHPGLGLGSRRLVRTPLPRHRRHAALCCALSPDFARGAALGRVEESSRHPVDAENASAFPRYVAYRVPPLQARAVEQPFSQEPLVCMTPRWRGESGANSSLMAVDEFLESYKK